MSYILSLPDWSRLALVSDVRTVRVSRFSWWVSSIIGLVVKEYLGSLRPILCAMIDAQDFREGGFEGGELLWVFANDFVVDEASTVGGEAQV